uniref:Uncharacterized protein n=1 Tax=Arundo donax TaxID=35708 RepID=A0A0A9A2T3_ARUDO
MVVPIFIFHARFSLASYFLLSLGILYHVKCSMSFLL